MIWTASIISAAVAAMWAWAFVVDARNLRDLRRMCDRIRRELDRMDAERRKRITGGTE